MTKGQLNQQASAYAKRLFSKELAAIQNLLNVGAAYVQYTGSDPNSVAETNLIREVIEFVIYGKVEFLLNDYGNDALKWFALRSAAAFANNLDQNYGGAGMPSWAINCWPRFPVPSWTTTSSSSPASTITQCSIR